MVCIQVSDASLFHVFTALHVINQAVLEVNAEQITFRKFNTNAP